MVKYLNLTNNMNYGKAIKKPVEINWYKWDGELDSLEDWFKSMDSLRMDFEDAFEFDENSLCVKTLEGTSYDVPNGYIIIRGVEGEYYPCEPNIFEKTYNTN